MPRYCIILYHTSYGKFIGAKGIANKPILTFATECYAIPWYKFKKIQKNIIKFKNEKNKTKKGEIFEKYNKIQKHIKKILYTLTENMENIFINLKWIIIVYNTFKIKMLSKII